MSGKLKITLRRSTVSRPQDQKDTARALGLRKMHRSVVHPDNPALRGMVRKIAHLVAVEELAE